MAIFNIDASKFASLLPGAKEAVRGLHDGQKNLAAAVPASLTPDPTFGKASRSDATATPGSNADPQHRAQDGIKCAAWAIAANASHARAAAAGKPADSVDAMPTITDYLVAIRSPQILAAVEEQGLGKAWNTKVAVDFSGMTLRNVNIQKDHFSPESLTPGDRERLHMTADEISTLYRETSAFIDFDDTKLYNVHFHPANTFDEYVRGKASEVVGCTFDGMTAASDDVRLVGKPGVKFEDVHFTNITGGTIIVGIDEKGNDSRTSVKDLHIEGVHATLAIGGDTTIDGIHCGEADVRQPDGSMKKIETHLVDIQARAGASIINADFTNSTLSMHSELKGTKWENVTFADASLNGVDMQGATLTHVDFLTKRNALGLRGEGCDLSHLDLTGATLTDVVIERGATITGLNLSKTKIDGLEIDANEVQLDGLDLRGAEIRDLRINGELITSAQQLNDMGIRTDADTKFADREVTRAPDIIQDLVNKVADKLDNTTERLRDTVKNVAAETAGDIKDTLVDAVKGKQQEKDAQKAVAEAALRQPKVTAPGVMLADLAYQPDIANAAAQLIASMQQVNRNVEMNVAQNAPDQITAGLAVANQVRPQQASQPTQDLAGYYRRMSETGGKPS